jgi:hypothetical protein
MSGGSTTKTVTEPWEEQKPYLVEGFKQAGGLYNRGAPAYYPGQMTAQPSGTEQMADISARNYLTGPRVAAQQAQAEKSLIGGMGGQVDYSQYAPMANVYGQQYLSEIQKNMPAVRQSMVEYQPGGGSRGDIVQAGVAGAAGKNLAQNLAGLYGGAYSAAQERIPQFTNQYQSIMNAPMDMYGQLGQIGQKDTARTQAAIDADMARYQYEAAAPQTQLANYMKTISGDYGGTETEVAPNQFMTSLMTGLGTAASGWLTSDIRIKENITPDGTWKGHNVYHFNYIGDGLRRRGVMAQEVEQARPDAVMEIDGIKHVNYGDL